MDEQVALGDLAQQGGGVGGGILVIEDVDLQFDGRGLVVADRAVVVRGRLPEPPALAYVVRRARKARNPALDSLIAEIEAEISRYGGLSLAV